MEAGRPRWRRFQSIGWASFNLEARIAKTAWLAPLRESTEEPDARVPRTRRSIPRHPGGEGDCAEEGRWKGWAGGSRRGPLERDEVWQNDWSTLPVSMMHRKKRI